MPGLLSQKLMNTCTVVIRWQLVKTISSSVFLQQGKMASEKKLLCLFDVDGTLTAPRKVGLT